jgi:hypothetical protein
MRLARLIEAVRGLPESLKSVAILYLEDMPVREKERLLARRSAALPFLQVGF